MPFTKLGVHFPFSDFKVAMMNRMRFAPSQLHPGVLAYMKVSQLIIEHKYRAPSIELFFNLFYVAYTSRDDAWDHRLIFLRPNFSWFDHFTNDWGKFLERFMLVKPITPEAHFEFCLSSTLVWFIRSCKSAFLKYRSRVHFCKPLLSYYIRLSSLSVEEVKMKEDMCT